MSCRDIEGILDGLASADPVCARAIKHWGHSEQERKANEEMGELLTALSRHPTRATKEDVAEEIADVLIMCRQLALIFGDDLVAAALRRKGKRLRDRLDREQEAAHG